MTACLRGRLDFFSDLFSMRNAMLNDSGSIVKEGLPAATFADSLKSVWYSTHRYYAELVHLLEYLHQLLKLGSLEGEEQGGRFAGRAA